MMKDKPDYKKRYQIELAEELTGRTRITIRKMMSRRDLTLAGCIRFYLNKLDVSEVEEVEEKGSVIGFDCSMNEEKEA